MERGMERDEDSEKELKVRILLRMKTKAYERRKLISVI